MTSNLDSLCNQRSQLAEAIDAYYKSLIARLAGTHLYRGGRQIKVRDVEIPIRVLEKRLLPLVQLERKASEQSTQAEASALGLQNPKTYEAILFWKDALTMLRNAAMHGDLDASRVVVLGAPGEGKSFLAQISVIEEVEAARREWEECAKPLSALPLPVYADLNQLAERLHTNADPVEALLDVVVHQSESSPRLRQWMRDQLPTADCLLVLDALDQVNPNFTPSLMRWLQVIEQGQWRCRILITCRTMKYSDSLLPWSHAPKAYELVSFRKEERDLFVEKWFRGDEDKRKLDRASFQDVLNHNATLAQACNLPLILTLACLSHETAPLGRNTRRGELYHQVLKNMLARAWRNPEARIVSPEHVSDLSLMLVSVAGELFSHNPGVNSFSRSDVVNAIRKANEDVGATPWKLRLALERAVRSVEKRHDVENAAPNLLLDELVDECNILLVAGAGQNSELEYSFAHRTFLEFLVAKAFVEQIRRGDWDAVMQHIDHAAADVNWHEVIILLTGELAVPNENMRGALQAMLRLLQDRVQDDCFGSRLALAVRCIEEILVSSPSPALTKTMEEVRGAFMNLLIGNELSLRAGHVRVALRRMAADEGLVNWICAQLENVMPFEEVETRRKAWETWDRPWVKKQTVALIQQLLGDWWVIWLPMLKARLEKWRGSCEAAIESDRVRVRDDYHAAEDSGRGFRTALMVVETIADALRSDDAIRIMRILQRKLPIRWPGTGFLVFTTPQALLRGGAIDARELLDYLADSNRPLSNRNYITEWLRFSPYGSHAPELIAGMQILLRAPGPRFEGDEPNLIPFALGPALGHIGASAWGRAQSITESLHAEFDRDGRNSEECHRIAAAAAGMADLAEVLPAPEGFWLAVLTAAMEGRGEFEARWSETGQNHQWRHISANSIIKSCGRMTADHPDALAVVEILGKILRDLRDYGRVGHLDSAISHSDTIASLCYLAVSAENEASQAAFTILENFGTWRNVFVSSLLFSMRPNWRSSFPAANIARLGRLFEEVLWDVFDRYYSGVTEPEACLQMLSFLNHSPAAPELWRRLQGHFSEEYLNHRRDPLAMARCLGQLANSQTHPNLRGEIQAVALDEKKVVQWPTKIEFQQQIALDVEKYCAEFREALESKPVTRPFAALGASIMKFMAIRYWRSDQRYEERISEARRRGQELSLLSAVAWLQDSGSDASDEEFHLMSERFWKLLGETHPENVPLPLVGCVAQERHHNIQSWFTIDQEKRARARFEDEILLIVNRGGFFRPGSHQAILE